MATAGTYSDGLRITLIISDEGGRRAILQLRKMAPNGHYRDDYELEHDDDFPVTCFRLVDGSEVLRKHYRGPSEERPAHSSRTCPKEETHTTFRLEKIMSESGNIYRLQIGDNVSSKMSVSTVKLVVEKSKDDSVAKEKPADDDE